MKSPNRRLRTSSTLSLSAALLLIACGGETQDADSTSTQSASLGEAGGAEGEAGGAPGEGRGRRGEGERPAAERPEGDRPEAPPADAAPERDGCRAEARAAAAEAAAQCAEADGGRGRCALAAREAHRDAMLACGPIDPEDAPLGERPRHRGGRCLAECRHEAHQAGRACVEEGGEPAECRAAGRESVEACVAACAERGRPEGDRPEGDRPEGDRPEGDRPEGDRPEGDRPEGDRPGHDCPEGERPEGERPEGDRPDQPPPPPPPDACFERCGLQGREADRACNEAGGDPRECRRDARALVEACIQENCDAPPPPPAPPSDGERPDQPPPPPAPPSDGERPDQPPPPPPPADECLAACGAEGRDVHRACTEAGGAPERCFAAARDTVEACIQESCDAPPPPPPAR